MIEQALRTFLLSKAAIASIVAGIHTGDFAPQAEADMPAIGIEGEESPAAQSLDGTIRNLQFPIFTIKAKARQFVDSTNLIDLACAAFRGVPLGMVVTTTVNGAPATVTIVQVDLISNPYNDEEVDYGHGFTIKPRCQKIRVGWRVQTNTI